MSNAHDFTAPAAGPLPTGMKAVETCPKCGGPMVNTLEYRGGVGYRTLTLCWNAMGEAGCVAKVARITCPDCGREQSFHGRCDKCEKRAYAL